MQPVHTVPVPSPNKKLTRLYPPSLGGRGAARREQELTHKNSSGCTIHLPTLLSLSSKGTRERRQRGQNGPPQFLTLHIVYDTSERLEIKNTQQQQQQQQNGKNCSLSLALSAKENRRGHQAAMPHRTGTPTVTKTGRSQVCTNSSAANHRTRCVEGPSSFQPQKK